MKNNYLCVTILLLLTCSVLYSQNTKLAKADKAYERLSYINAIEIYEKVAEEGYKSADLYKKIGNSYYFNNDYDKAVKWYRKLFENYEKRLKSEYFFRYAQSLKAIKLYDESDEYMQKFYKKENGSVAQKNFKTDEQYLNNLTFQSGKYKLGKIKANSPYSDFGPAFFGEKLVFASSRDTGTFSKRIHKWNNRPFLDLFVGEIDEKTKNVEEVEGLSSVLNSKFHESTPVFTKDGKTIYFTRNNFNKGVYGKSVSGINKLKIYRSTLSDAGIWSQPESLSFNSDEYVVAHPALGVDERKLYFSSTMKGGKGLSDLYVVDVHADGSFGDPVNLGEIVNTQGKESFPFVDTVNNDLYFASNGQMGLGGLDIFVVKLGENGLPVGKVTNIGKPANSSEDDFAFILDSEKKIGYLSSNRVGGKGDDDIYSFIQIDELERNCTIFVEGVVTDVESGKLLPKSKVSLFNTSNIEVASVIVGKDASYKFEVDCNKNYFVRVENKDYDTYETLISTSSLQKDQSKVFLYLTKSVKTIEVGNDLGKILNLNPIYFDYNKATIRYDAELELAKVIAVLKKYPKMKIDVRSHTDSRGNDNYNLLLSDKRAKSTIKHIIKKAKISKDRVSGAGYGESQLVNKCGNGVKCSEEEHQLNRRSEFIILEQ